MERQTNEFKINDNVSVKHYINPIKKDLRSLEALVSKTIEKGSTDLGEINLDLSKVDTIELGNLQLSGFVKAFIVQGKEITDREGIIDTYDNLEVGDTVELDKMIQEYFGDTQPAVIEKK